VQEKKSSRVFFYPWKSAVGRILRRHLLSKVRISLAVKKFNETLPTLTSSGGVVKLKVNEHKKTSGMCLQKNDFLGTVNKSSAFIFLLFVRVENLL